jgi:hypothetical protein
MEGDANARGKPVHGLVDRVVDDFPHQVMQAGAADAADVHARALADGLEPLEDGDVFCGIRRHCRGECTQKRGASRASCAGHAPRREAVERRDGCVAAREGYLMNSISR